MRTNPLFWPVSLSLGIHVALIALVLGQTGSGGGIVPRNPAAGPIIVDIVSFGPGESASPGGGRTHPIARISETANTVPESPPMPAQKTRVIKELIASHAPKIPIPPQSGSPLNGIEEGMAVENALTAEPAENSTDESADGGPAPQAGLPGAHQPILAYVAGLQAAGLPGSTSNDGPGIDFLMAKATDLPEPVYPTWSRRRGQEGKVILSVRIGSDGRLSAVSVVRPSGFSMLDQAAAEALRKASFSPASAAGVPVSSTRKIAYSFRITDARD